MYVYTGRYIYIYMKTYACVYKDRLIKDICMHIYILYIHEYTIMDTCLMFMIRDKVLNLYISDSS